jgi:hypothetical protein
MPSDSSFKQEVMETGQHLNLNAGYYQCKTARRNQVCKTAIDVSVTGGGGGKSPSPHRI